MYAMHCLTSRCNTIQQNNATYARTLDGRPKCRRGPRLLRWACRWWPCSWLCCWRLGHPYTQQFKAATSHISDRTHGEHPCGHEIEPCWHEMKPCGHEIRATRYRSSMLSITGRLADAVPARGEEYKISVSFTRDALSGLCVPSMQTENRFV